MERVHDDELKEYEGLGEHVHNVPQDGVAPRPPASKDPEEFPARKQPPAHQGLGPTPATPASDTTHVDRTDERRDEPPPHAVTDHGSDTKIWDEASQRYMEGVAKDRKQATEADYHDTSEPANGAHRDDTAPH